MIATSIEQSRRLINAGVNPDTFCVSKAIAKDSNELIENFVGIIEREKMNI